MLVADDDPASRRLMEVALGVAGFEVAVVTNGQEALDLLDAGYRPAVVLLDLRMPVLDGEAFRAAQLARPAIRDVPVLGLAAELDPRLDLEVILKPASVPHLVARLRALARAAEEERRRPRRRLRRALGALLAAGLAAGVKMLLDRLLPRRRR